MPASRRPRRGLATVAIVVVAAALLYATVVALYAIDQESRIAAECEPTAGEAVVELSPKSVDAVQDRIAVTVDVTEEGPLALTPLGYAGSVTLIVDGSDGSRAFTTPADTIPGVVSLSLIADGDIALWPFDVHTAAARIVLVQTVGTEPSAVLPEVCARGQVSGWTLTATGRSGDDDLAVGEDNVPVLVLTATRSPATVAFGLVILALMTALPVLGLTVAIAAFRGRRKTEATLMSWMAAMLFAIIPLRTFLPGSPPVGSWVDYLVVLWVVGGLVAALVVYVAAWLRWTPAAGERPER